MDLVSVMACTAVCGTARPGSIPRQGTLIDMSLECAGFARDFAMVEDQVRFLAGTLHDAGARRHGNRLQPGRSGFDSGHRSAWMPDWSGVSFNAISSKRPMMLTRQRRTGPTPRECGCGWLGVFRAMASKASGFIVEAQWLSTRLLTWVLRVRVPSTAPDWRPRRESVYHEARGRRTYVQSAAVRSVL
jgi:hypothetical protein